MQKLPGGSWLQRPPCWPQKLRVVGFISPKKHSSHLQTSVVGGLFQLTFFESIALAKKNRMQVAAGSNCLGFPDVEVVEMERSPKSAEVDVFISLPPI